MKRMRSRKVAFECYAEYFMSVRYSHAQLFSFWVAALRGLISLFKDETLRQHPAIAQFLSIDMTPVNKDDLVSALIAEKRKKSKKKSKPKAVVTATMTQTAPEIEFEEVSPNEISAEVLTAIISKMRQSSALDQIARYFYHIASLLHLQCEISDAFGIKISQWLILADKLNHFDCPVFVKSSTPLEKPLREYWNLAIRTLLLASDPCLKEDAIPELKNEINQFIQMTIQYIDVRHESLPVISEVYTDLQRFFPPNDSANTILIVGSVAQQLVQDALGDTSLELKIDTDVDMAVCVHTPDGPELDKILFELKCFFETQKNYGLNYHKASSPNEPYKISYTISYKGISFDIVIYCKNNEIPLLSGIDSFKRFYFDCQNNKLHSTQGDLLLLLQNLRSFDDQCFENSASVAYFLREEAKRKMTSMELSTESRIKATEFINNPEKSKILSEAIGYYLTKYTFNIESIYFQYILEENLIFKIEPFNSIMKNKSAMRFIKDVTNAVMQKFAYSPKGDNIFPVVILSLYYIYQSCDETFSLSMCLSKINELAFPLRVRNNVVDTVTHWFNLRSGLLSILEVSLLVNEIFNIVRKNEGWVLGYNQYAGPALFQRTQPTRNSPVFSRSLNFK